jgi:putative protease
MRHAFLYGADAVYAGLPKYSLRVRNNTFSKDNALAVGIAEAHSLGKKLFVAANLFPHNNKIKSFIADMEPIVELNPDGLIMADPGLIMLVRERWPDLPVHLSVQMNTMNYQSVKFWQSIGIKRIILSRELSLDEVERIRQECPDIELEVFVHGALCIAYSGRCLLSGYFTHRDANQGTCTNTCRWKYSASDAEESEEGDIVRSGSEAIAQTIVRSSSEAIAQTIVRSGSEAIAQTILPKGALERPQLFSETGQARHPEADKVYFLEEEQRKGELMPVFEDEHGTYIMNSKDLRAIEHVDRLVKMGIDCLKIEGRTKSHYYVARTAQAYSKAIDLAMTGKPLDPGLIGVLENLANRGYTDGFYQRHHTAEHQKYIVGATQSRKQMFVGEAVGREGDDLIIQVKNHFEVGNRLEFSLPNGQSRDIILTEMRDAKTNQPVTAALGSAYVVRIAAGDIEGDTVLISKYL